MLQLNQPADLIDWQNPVSEHPLNRGLVSWWLAHPERMGGVIWRDLCGRTHGTLTNMDPATDWGGAKGRPGGFGALDFDGSNDYVDLPVSVSSASVNYGSPISWCDEEDWGISFHYKGTDNEAVSSYRTAGILGWDSGSIYAHIGITNNKAAYIHYDAAAGGWNRILSTTGVNDDSWHHVMVVNHSNRTADIYVDGKKEADGISSDIRAGADGIRYFQIDSLMRTFSARYTSGLLDDVRIYNRAISSSEVLELYHESKAGHPNTLRRVTVPLWTPQAAAAASAYRIYERYYRQLLAGGMSV